MTLTSIQIARSGVVVSRLGLGLSRLHYLSERDAEALVHAAIDLGVTHFDAARLYGDGFAERILGRAIRGRRRTTTIATKFGLQGGRTIELLGRMGQPLRATRSIARRAHLWPGHAPVFSVANLERSVYRSLAALQTDHIDILFLHEPPPTAAATADDIFERLERFKGAGTITAVGVSAGTAGLAAFDAKYGEAIQVRQAPEVDWTATLPPDITFGAMADGPQRYGTGGLDTRTATARLSTALARRANGVVLVSTTRRDHLADLVRVAEGSGS